MRDLHPSTRGNTTIEYALAGLLICVVSIGVLLLLSGSVSAKISDLKNDVIAKADVAKEQSSLRYEQYQLSLTGESGMVNSFSADTENNSSATITTGANGNTLGSTSVVKGISNKNKKELTPAQEKLVKDIANNAHQIAQLQATLKQIAKFSGDNRDRFRNTTIVYKGTSITVREIANWLRSNSSLFNDNRALLDSLVSTGADPEVITKVNELNSKVSTDAEKSSNSVQDVLTDTGSPTTVVSNTNPTKTHQNAKSICGAAGGNDTGTYCGG